MAKHPTILTIILTLVIIAIFAFLVNWLETDKQNYINTITAEKDSTATALKQTVHELDSLKKFHKENCVQGLFECIPDDHVIVSKQELEYLRRRPPYPSPRPSPLDLKIPVLAHEDYQYYNFYDTRVYKLVLIDRAVTKDSTQQK